MVLLSNTHTHTTDIANIFYVTWVLMIDYRLVVYNSTLDWHIRKVYGECQPCPPAYILYALENVNYYDLRQMFNITAAV